MINVCLLGTGGTTPLASRYLSSLLIKSSQCQVMFDCGEGTQMAVQHAKKSCFYMDMICLTHTHADHILGLPGLMASLENAGRTKPLTIVGPASSKQRIITLIKAAVYTTFDIVYYPITSNFMVLNLGELRISAFKVLHSVDCYGYVIDLPKLGEFSAEKAIDNGIPEKLWCPLQMGYSVKINEEKITKKEILGPTKQPLRIAYITDTRPTQQIVDNIRYADLAIMEGMYSEGDNVLALKNKHMTFTEAATIARDAGVEQLWLTHFSALETYPSKNLANAKKIFKNVICGSDGYQIDLKFR